MVFFFYIYKDDVVTREEYDDELGSDVCKEENEKTDEEEQNEMTGGFLRRLPLCMYIFSSSNFISLKLYQTKER